MELRRLIGEFIRASIGNIPLTGILTWGLFRGLVAANVSRVPAVILSSVLVAAGLALLTGLSDLGQHNAFQTISIGIWLIIGLLCWGRTKPHVQQ
jgi:membrane protein required for beta-lactamase induction